DRLARLVEHLEGAPRMLEEHRARLGRRGATAASDQERDSDHALEVPHVVADRGLAQVQALARPREAARAGDRLERPHVHGVEVDHRAARQSGAKYLESYRFIQFILRIQMAAPHSLA